MKMPVSMDFKLKIFDHCVFEKVNPPLAYTDVSFEERENGSNGSVVRVPGLIPTRSLSFSFLSLVQEHIRTGD